MKTNNLLLVLALAGNFLACRDSSRAATVTVSGEVTDAVVGPPLGQLTLVSTLHFLELEVLSPGQVTITGVKLYGNEGFRVSPLVGVPYGVLGIDPLTPNNLFLYPGVLQNPVSESGQLVPGLYLFSIRLFDSEWIYDEEGFGPVGPQDHPGRTSGYVVTVSGDIRPIAMWRGQPNGTFIVQPLPEPGSVGLALVGGALMLCRRKRSG